MCSKNQRTEERTARYWSRHWSISRRLTLLCAASSFLMLVLATVYLYWSAVANLEREDNAFLAEKVRLLRNLLRDGPPDNLERLRLETESLGPTPALLQFHVRILKVTGESLLETPGMSTLIRMASFPPAPTGDESLRPGPELHLPNGKSFRLVSAWAPAGTAGGEAHVLQIALDVSNDEALLADFRRNLLFVVLIGVGLSAAAGVFIAKKTLQPLVALTQATERITGSHLQERVFPSGWPKELASLAKGFDRMLDRLEEAFNRLSQFSGDLAHELRTPINNLRGEAGVALSQARTPEQYCRVLESSLEEYARLARLIDNLLFLARADGAMASIHCSTCDARQAVEAVREYYLALAEDRGVELVTEGEATVEADLVLFRQAVSNLLANALNHTPRGGRVRISVRHCDDRTTELTVTDTGCGISAEHLPRIFDRFYRVDPAPPQPSASGFGLGLSIVKSIMELHGGSVRVQSEVSQGTTATLQFPPSAGG